MSTLELKRGLRDMRCGKIKQIFVFATDDKYMADAQSAVVLLYNKPAHSILSMDESDLDEKTDETFIIPILEIFKDKFEV